MIILNLKLFINKFMYNIKLAEPLEEVSINLILGYADSHNASASLIAWVMLEGNAGLI